MRARPHISPNGKRLAWLEASHCAVRSVPPCRTDSRRGRGNRRLAPTSFFALTEALAAPRCRADSRSDPVEYHRSIYMRSSRTGAEFRRWWCPTPTMRRPLRVMRIGFARRVSPFLVRASRGPSSPQGVSWRAANDHNALPLLRRRFFRPLPRRRSPCDAPPVSPYPTPKLLPRSLRFEDHPLAGFYRKGRRGRMAQRWSRRSTVKFRAWKISHGAGVGQDATSCDGCALSPACPSTPRVACRARLGLTPKSNREGAYV